MINAISVFRDFFIKVSIQAFFFLFETLTNAIILLLFCFFFKQ